MKPLLHQIIFHDCADLYFINIFNPNWKFLTISQNRIEQFQFNETKHKIFEKWRKKTGFLLILTSKQKPAHLIGAFFKDLLNILPYWVTRELPCHCASQLDDVFKST